MTKCWSKSVENQKQKQSYEEKEITGIHNDQHKDDIEMKP